MFKKTKEGFEIMEERNRRYLESLEKKNAEEKAVSEEESAFSEATEECEAIEQAEVVEQVLDEEPADRDEPQYDLEKGDLPAIIISAFLTFAPVILVLIGILALAWHFLH